MGLGELSEAEKKSVYNVIFNKSVTDKDLIKFLYNNKTPIFLLDKRNKPFFTNKAALNQIKYSDIREVCMCLREKTKRNLDRIINARRTLEKYEPASLKQLKIKTYDGWELTFYNLNVNIYNEFSAISFEIARKNKLKLQKIKERVYFKAPVCLDSAVDSVKLKLKAKNWIEDLICYCLNKPEKQKIEIDMHNVRSIGKEFIEIVKNTLVDDNFLISKPTYEIYNKLIVNNFPQKNIINYNPPKITESIVERTLEQKLRKAYG